MTKQNKEQICQVLKEQIDNEVHSLNQLKSLEPSKTFFEKQQRLAQRHAKIFIDYCK